MKSRDGFTIIEVLIAVIFLSVGLLAMVGTSAYASRTMFRGHSADEAAVFAANRLEMLRPIRASLASCPAASTGADTLKRGSAWIAINSWTITAPATTARRISLTSTYQVGPGKTRSDVMESAFSCIQ